MGCEFSDVVRFDLVPLLQGQMRTAKLIQYNLYYPTLLGEEQLVRIIEGSDNRRAKITGLNGLGRVGLRSDN